MQELKILVTGGGSAGHISPALAIIKTIEEMAAEPGVDWKPRFLYIGGKRGLEKGQVEAAGIPFVGVETGKLRRYFSSENFTDMARIPVGVLQAMWHVHAFKPDVVLATGGYVAVPPVIAGMIGRRPIITHEQTVQIGLANRINARFATRIGLSWESALEELSPALRQKASVVGNPVRPAIFGGSREAALQFCNFDAQDDVPTLYLTGGSQGARILNRAVEDVLPELLQLCRVIHQCGQQPKNDEQDFDRLERAAAQLPPHLRSKYFYTRFVREEINHVFALSDLVLSRAGAGTVTELCALGKAAIYVPLVPTGGDEQTRNAQMCERVGAATIIKQSEVNGQRLLDTVKTLLSQPQQLETMGQAALTLAKPNAARDMARVVIELAQCSHIS
jgi:UDP-N-acetylglucosamine--N-acetylmuramyl-(pentapeptide) pyrophosphoryl-undecaprenol N-acetylglucosamine transferase